MTDTTTDAERKPADDALDDDGADGPRVLSSLGTMFSAAAVLLLLPRQWAAAGAAFLVAVGISLAHAVQTRHKPSDGNGDNDGKSKETQ